MSSDVLRVSSQTPPDVSAATAANMASGGPSVEAQQIYGTAEALEYNSMRQ